MVEKLRFIASFLVSIIVNSFGKNPRRTARNILIIRLDHMGDVIYTLEAMQNIRREYPKCHICLVTGSWNTELFINSPLIDSLIIYNSPVFTRKMEEAAGFKDRIALLMSLKKMHFDMIISFRDDFFTIFLALFLFPQFRKDIGTIRLLAKLKQLSDKFLMKDADPSQHEIETNKKVILPLIDTYVHSNEFFQFTTEEEGWLEEFLRTHNLKKKDYAIIHPGAFWKFRRWDYSRFKEVGLFLYDKFGLKSVIIGLSDELDIGRKICEGDKRKFLNIIGETRLRETLILIANATIMICNDSGPMHFASQLGMLTICLLGPAEIQRFGPRGNRVFYFHKQVECWPCKQISCKRPQLPCVNLTTSSEVIKVIERELVQEGYIYK